MQLRVCLEPSDGPRPESTAEPSGGAALQHDHRQLAELLRTHTDLRHTLRHLVCVEQTLLRQGARALHTLPEKVLAKALVQIHGLGRDDAHFILPELTRRLRHALAVAEARANQLARPDAMEVSEASHSLFDEMDRSWNGHKPALK